MRDSGSFLQHVDVEVVVALPVAADPLGQAEALPGGLDRRLQHLPERHAPEAVEQPAPAVHGAGHGGAVHAVERHLVQAALVVEGDRMRGGRPAGGVQPVELVGPWPSSRSPPCRRRFRRSPARSDPSIAAVATAASTAFPPSRSDLEARLRGQRLAGRDHAVAREHLGAGLLRPVPHPVTAHGGDVPGRVRVPRRRRPERRRRDAGPPPPAPNATAATATVAVAASTAVRAFTSRIVLPPRRRSLNDA